MCPGQPLRRCSPSFSNCGHFALNRHDNIYADFWILDRDSDIVVFARIFPSGGRCLSLRGVAVAHHVAQIAPRDTFDNVNRNTLLPSRTMSRPRSNAGYHPSSTSMVLDSLIPLTIALPHISLSGSHQAPKGLQNSATFSLNSRDC